MDSLRIWSSVLGGIGIVLALKPIGDSDVDPSVILASRVVIISMLLSALIIEIYLWRKNK